MLSAFATLPSQVMWPQGPLAPAAALSGTRKPSMRHKSSPTAISSMVVTGEASAATLFWL